MKKRLISVILTALLGIMIGLPGVTLAAEEDRDRVVDNAGLLSASAEEELEETLDRISHTHACDVVLLTEESLYGQDITAYADDYFDYNGYGYGSTYDGILFLIDMDYREWAISTCGFGIRAFTDAGQEYMMNQILPYLSAEDYETAFARYAELCDDFIGKARDGQAYTAATLPRAPLTAAPFVVCVLISGVIAFIACGVMKSQLTTVRAQNTAGNYMRDGSMRLTASHDTFLYRNVSRREKPQQSSSGGGSSTHHSSSGRTHGGSHGKF